MSNKAEMRREGKLPKMRRFKKVVGANGRKTRRGVKKHRRISTKQ